MNHICTYIHIGHLSEMKIHILNNTLIQYKVHK